MQTASLKKTAKKNYYILKGYFKKNNENFDYVISTSRPFINCYTAKCFAVKYNYFKRTSSITTQTQFSEKSFDEVKVKDIVKEKVSKYKPEYNERALLYSFTARMNVLRKIYKYNKDKEYVQVLNEYDTFFVKNYKKIQKLLGKRRVEYFLYGYARLFYRCFVKGK